MELLRKFIKIRKIQLDIQTPTDDNTDKDHPCTLYSTNTDQYFIVK